MNGRWKGAAVAALGLSLFFLLLISAGHGQRAMAQSAPAAMGQAAQPATTKTAAEAYKNIKVLKNIPAYELIPTMEFISASLGVHCDYCHVEHHFDQDTKKPKLRAREMMQMMFAIDKDHFHGHQAVTCNTCHNGSAHPAGMPAVAEAQEVPMRPAHAEEGGRRFDLSSLPQPDAIIAKYVQALGGADALRTVKSRVITGTVTAFGHEMPIEIDAQAPNERASVMKSPRGESATVYNGQEGWVSMGPRPPHPLEGSALDQARIEADFYFPLNIQQTFSRLRERPPQKVGDQMAYVLMGMQQGEPPVELFFSQQTGLLLRRVTFTQTALGRLPQQTDYSDYRKVDGVKVPFQWTVAEPRGQSTVQASEVRQNVPISAEKFAKPAAHGPAGQ